MQRFFLTPIKIYQNFVSPLLGPHCRFYPSCSDYTVLAIQKHGIVKGVAKAFWRIARCGPWSRGGVDLP